MANLPTRRHQSLPWQILFYQVGYFHSVFSEELEDRLANLTANYYTQLLQLYREGALLLHCTSIPFSISVVRAF